MKPVEIPIRFPHPATVIREEAERFRRLTDTEQFRAVLQLMALGEWMVERSPNRERIERMIAADEARWQKAHRELFARHGI